jgi:mRNA m6A methyltransferase catalytic subunit
MSVDERLKIVVSSALRSIFSSGKVTTPISSFDLLARVISAGPPPSGLLPGLEPAPRLRLTDSRKFESVVECLSQEWTFGRIVTYREEESGELTVLDVQLGQVNKARASDAMPHGKKRKRIVDEDADSAAGDLAEEEEEHRKDEEAVSTKPAPTTLNSLTKEMKEVYSLLQRGTARGKLLAEEVSSFTICFCHYAHCYTVPLGRFGL